MESRVVVPTVSGMGVLMVRSIMMRLMVCRVGVLMLGMARFRTARRVVSSALCAVGFVMTGMRMMRQELTQ